MLDQHGGWNAFENLASAPRSEPAPSRTECDLRADGGTSIKPVGTLCTDGSPVERAVGGGPPANNLIVRPCRVARELR